MDDILIMALVLLEESVRRKRLEIELAALRAEAKPPDDKPPEKTDG